MIRLLTAVFLFASFHAVAEVTLTELNNDTPADADEVMGNFNALKQGVEANATALQGLIEPNQLCGTGFSCLSGTYDYRYGSDAEAEWWGRPNANPNCGFGATGAFLYLLDSKWVLGTGLGGSSGVIATCNAATFVNHPTECGSNWEDANGPIEASFSSGSCGDQKLSDLNCGHDQIIKREGSAWVCATDVLAGLVCEEEDTITFRNGTWRCSSEPQDCTTYYRDYDEDGYGDPANSQCLSSPTGLYTSTNANDCFDYNADAKPGQTGYFGEHRGDGSYDYDCDASEERKYTVGGAQSCSFVGETCTTDTFGWTSYSPPSCGNMGTLLTSCEVEVIDYFTSVCNDVAVSQRQTCQ